MPKSDTRTSASQGQCAINPPKGLPSVPARASFPMSTISKGCPQRNKATECLSENAFVHDDRITRLNDVIQARGAVRHGAVRQTSFDFDSPIRSQRRNSPAGGDG